jgi:membrane-associated phospholipid phosphatase
MMRPLIKLRIGGAAAALLACGTPQLAAGQQIPVTPLRYSIGWQDAAVTGGSVVLTAIPTLLGAHLPYASCAPCDPSHLWGIDRHFVGEPRGGLGTASTATLVVAVFAGGALLLDAHAADPSGAKWEDLAVYAQAVSVNAALTSWSKVLFHRPRPVRYTPNAASYGGVNEGLSFPSGHTSMAFASAAAYTSMLQRRHAVGSHRGEVALMFGAAVATGVLRVAARKHFPTDVVAGAVLGTAVGWVIPQLHSIR